MGCDTVLLFESLRGVPGNERLKGYELKDSFMGGEEADLVMLTTSHEEISQEELAHDVLRCSKNAVGERRARMRDGIRIGGMGIQAEFSYRGAFQSSVHPVCVPLNLSEVYVLFDALAEYAREKDGQDPHRKTAERLAGMVKSQLSDYAKKMLQTRLEEMKLAEEHGIQRKSKRPCLVVRCAGDDYDIVPWAEVVDARRA